MLTVPGDDEAKKEAPKFRFPDLEGSKDAQKDGLLSATVRASQEIPPEQAARVLRMQVKTGFDRDIIARNLEDVEREAAAADFQPELFRRNSPKMAKWLSESPYHVSVAREDLKALGNLEALFYRKDDPTRPLSDKEVEAKAERAAKRRAPLIMQRQKADPTSALSGYASEADAQKGIYAQELSRRQRAERFISGEGSIGPMEAVKKRFDENPAFLLPFGGSIYDSGNALTIYEAAKAKVAGTADEEQEDLIFQLARLQAASERRGSGLIGGAAEILAALPAVAGEFAATGGTYRGVKVGVEGLLHNAMKQAIAGSTRGAIRKTAGVLAGGAAQTLAMGAGIPGEVAGRMTPRLQAEISKNGELRAILDPSTADDMGPAILKTLGSRFVETLSERAGVGMERLAGPMKKALVSRYMAKFPEESVDGFLAKVKSATGWNGVVGEVFEERVAEVGKAAIGAEDYKPPTEEQLISEILAFSVPGAGAAAISSTKKALSKKEVAQARVEETLPATQVLEAVVKTVQESGLIEKAPEAAEQAIQAAAVDTSAEYAYADARTFNQVFSETADPAGGKIDPKALAARLGVEERDFNLAVETGGDLKVKTSRAAMELIPNGYEAFFRDHLRFDPGDMSRAETEAEVKRVVDEAKAEAVSEERKVASKQYAEGAKRIREAIETGLKASSRVKANEVKTFGKLVEAAFRVMGERYGLDPEQQFSKYDLEIRGPQQAQATQPSGQVFNQPSPQGGFDVEIQKRAIAHFGTTIVAQEAGYILPDGTMLDLSGRNNAVGYEKTSEGFRPEKGKPDYLAGTRNSDHRDIPSEVLSMAGSGTERMFAFQKASGAMRFMPGVGISGNFLPTPEQIRAVVKAWKDYFPGDSIMVDVDDPSTGNNLVSVEVKRQSVYKVGKVFADALGGDAKSYFQPAEGGVNRGHLHIGKNLKVALDLLDASDQSTPPHEFFGHFWLHMMGDIIDGGHAPEAMKADFQEILDYLGAKDRASITDAQHEKFARTIEKYLMDGHAPSKALRGVFFRFFEWLTEIYREIKEAYFSGVDLSPRIKAVLDRLLATDAEIQAAQAEEGRGALFSDFAAAKKAGASDAEAQRHMKAQADLRAAATARILKRTMGDIKQENEDWWLEQLEEKKAQVAKEIDSKQVYKMLAAFKEGKLPEGADVGGISPGTKIKLDTKAVESMLGVDVNVSPVIPKYVTARRGGVHPDIAADMWFGYPSGAEMLDAIASAEPREQAIERIAEERMRAEYGEPPSQAEIADQAQIAIHGEEYGALIESEMRILAKTEVEGQKDAASILFARLPNRAILKARAKEHVASSAYSSIDPKTYEAAERRAAVRAVKAYTAGDRAGAIKAKSEQLANVELFSAARAAKEYVSDKLVDFRKIYKKDEKLAKSRDVDLINAARAILARVNIGKVEKSASGYLEAIKKYDPDIYEALLPMVLDAGDGTREWRDLSYGELRKTFEAVDAIWELSLRTKQFEVLGKKMDLDEVVEDLRQAVSAMSPAQAKEFAHAVTTWARVKMGFLGIKASLRRMESWVDMMDGGNPNGVFRRYLFTPISEGADKARKMRRGLEKELAGIFKAMEADFTAEKIDAPELGYRFGDGGSGFAELFGTLLHTGNASNKQKLLRGDHWGEIDSETGILDDSRWEAFRERMIREGKIRKEHYEAAQKIWDMFEREKALAWKAHRDMYGFYPSEITAEPIVTPWGTFRGGYVPAKADSEKANDAERREEKDALERNDNSFAFPSAGLGATLKRSEGYAKPLVKDVRLLRSHINWLSRFVHIQPRVRDVGRLMLKHDFRDALDAFDPAAGNDLIAPFLQRAATQVVETPMKGKGGRAIATVAREVRKRTGTLLMMGNLTNALQNFTGLFLAAVKVKPRFLRDSLFKYIRDPKGLAQANREASVFMENRTDTEVQAMVGDMEAMLVNPSALEKVKDWTDRHGMFFQRVTQNVLDNVVWDAAKDQAISEGSSPEEAVRQANSAVRQTQSSGAPEDVSRAETGNAVIRVFNQFWNYFNMQANLLGTEFAKTADGMGLKRGAGRALYIYTMGFMLPAVVAEVIVSLAKGGLDDEDDDGYLDEVMGLFFGSQARTAAALMPGGAIVRSGWGAFTKDNRYDDRIQTSPAISILESAVKAPASIYRAVVDQGKTSTAVKDSMTLLGLLSGLPLPAVARPIGYISDVAEEVANPDDPVDVVRGLLTGRPGLKD